MYAVHVSVTIDPSRADEAMRLLHDSVVPGSKQAPGFQRGTWFGDGTTKGYALMTFDSEANAQHAASMVSPNADDPVTLESVDVLAVQAET
jgi:hypothetical protein